MTVSTGNGGSSGPARTWPDPFQVTFIAETGSTNADLLAAAGDLPHGTVLVADRQTAGRGRLDRTWESAPIDPDRGPNLLVSILFTSGLEAPHRLTQRVGIAAVRACERIAGVSPSLKWPNDLLLGDAKLAGILAQAGGRPGRIDHVVVGIGLNVAWAPPGAARLRRGHRDEVLGALLDALADLPEPHLDEYRRLLGTLGSAVRVELADETFEGIALDVDDDGHLIVDTSNGVRSVGVGDVVHLRRAE